jgi:beta-mannosidase
LTALPLKTTISALATANEIPFAAWSCCAQPAASITHPDHLQETPADWLPAIVPGTVASTLHANGQWDINQPLDADGKDWWYRTSFPAPSIQGGLCFLCLDGLATLAEVWLNGHHLVTTDNMFRAYRIDIAAQLQEHNELAIVFRSVTHDLIPKRPRPRWKTNLVNHQQIRWHRTTLLGRIPGWSPPVPAIGPWRAVRLDFGPVCVSEPRIATTLEGDVGVVTLHARLDTATLLEQASLQVGNYQVAAEVQADADGCHIHATLRIPDPPLWWPHTHGEQHLLDSVLMIHVGGEVHEFPSGKISFRQLEVKHENGFEVFVNGEPIYCRGACWTVNDIVALDGTPTSLEHDLRLARAAGMNMLRVGGTMIYESDRFYQLCDELGIMVWQDFMFANMDYPVEDSSFAANIAAEAKYQLSRLSKHPSVVMYCGSSEIEQQAAMLGMPRELWRNRWFGERLPALCAEYHPGTGYVPSTPSGGVMPFHVKSGITHFYGVGAYMRSPMEVRRADVKFTPECLAFANVPDQQAVNALMNGSLPVAHHPQWKQRIPRDTGAGWDFEDIRDFYLRHFFGVDPVQLRCFDMVRYLQLSRVVTGEMMAQVYAEWRSAYSHNHGALVWFFKDLWPAAGWGIVDSLGIPKAAYYYLRHSWQNRQVTITDEGLDGLHLHIINETTQPLNGSVELLLLKDAHIVTARQEVPCQLLPRSRQTLESDAMLDRFYDVSYAYRFGPAKHDVVVATLYDDKHQAISDAYHFMHQREPIMLSECNLEINTELIDKGRYQVTLRTDRFLQSVSFDVEGFLPDDNYFHLCPSREKRVLFTPFKDCKGALKGYVEALNLRNPVKIAVTKS